MSISPAAAGGPGAFIDLHLHSTASDGVQTPSEVVEAAIAARLHTIALTDHDTVAGVAPAREAAGGRINVVAGVELSAYQGDDEVHLLGLHLSEVDRMHHALEAFRDARYSRGRDMVTRLNAIGVRITFEEVLEVARDAAIGRPHVAKVLVENGWARDFRDAFDRYLGAGRPAFLEKRRLTLGDAIAMVHDCGGVAVLAHPGSGTGRERLAALQSAWGLDGSEVIHPAHTEDDRRRLLAAVTSLGMIPSGGSDAHGNTDGPRVIGAMHVPLEWLLVQQACVESRRRDGQVVG